MRGNMRMTTMSGYTGTHYPQHLSDTIRIWLRMPVPSVAIYG